MTRLAYILAASHSGSTLLSLLLGSHPQIATIGEVNLSPGAMGDVNRYRCSCGTWIGKCVFWQKVKEGMARRGFVFDLADAGTDCRTGASRYVRRLLGPLYRGRLLEGLRDMALGLSPSWRTRLPEIHRRNAALISTVCEITRSAIVVDSSKVALRLKYLLRNPELDVKVIHLIRDGRAVALTYVDPAGYADAQDAARRGGGMGGDRNGERLPMAQAAHQWRRCVEEAENILRCLPPSRWIEVRYERYCKAPQATLNDVQRFLGVEPAGRPTDFRAVEHHVVGNGMRLDSTSEVRLDERWRDRLTKRELKTFDDVAGRMNRRYGYE